MIFAAWYHGDQGQVVVVERQPFQLVQPRGAVVAQIQQTNHGVTATQADAIFRIGCADLPTGSAKRVPLAAQGRSKPDDALAGQHWNYSHGFSLDGAWVKRGRAFPPDKPTAVFLSK